MESITNGKKKEKVASRDLGEYKTGQTPKDVLTQLAEENEDLRKTIEETPPIYIGR